LIWVEEVAVHKCLELDGRTFMVLPDVGLVLVMLLFKGLSKVAI
jgi:hypothetical protein